MSEPKDPIQFNNPGRETLKDVDVANLGQAVLTLTKELWVVTDRLKTLETVLEKQGLKTSEEIESYQPDDNVQKQRRQESAELISRILSTLSAD